MNKDELLKLANDIATKAEGESKTQDIESAIAHIKADILTNVGKHISGLVAVDMLKALGQMKDSPFAPPPEPVFGGNVAYQIAECAEIIMRRAWIEKR